MLSSGPGPGQVRARKVRVRSESCELKNLNINLTYTIFLIFHPPSTHHGVEFSDGGNMGQEWSGRVGIPAEV